MTKRQNPNPEFDLFIPLMGDLPLKDQRETMERPFFSLQKRKRVKPIEYSSPDGDQSRCETTLPVGMSESGTASPPVSGTDQADVVPSSASRTK